MNLFLVALWSIAMLAGYYLFHKPITPDQTAVFLQDFLDCGLSAVLILAMGGIGQRLLSRLKVPGLAGAAVAFAAGSGVLSLVWLGLAALHLLFPVTAWLVLMIGLAVGFRGISDWIQGLVHCQN